MSIERDEILCYKYGTAAGGIYPLSHYVNTTVLPYLDDIYIRFDTFSYKDEITYIYYS